MPRLTAQTAKPLSLAERKAVLADLVKRGKLTAKQAALIDLREPTAKERAFAETLTGKARAALTRGKQAAA